MLEIVPHIIALILCIIIIVLCVMRLFCFDDTRISRVPYMLTMLFIICLIFCCSFSLKEKLDNPVSSSKDCDHHQVEVETTSDGTIHAKEKVIALTLCIIIIVLCVIRLFYFGDTGISRVPYMLTMIFIIYLMFCCSFSLKEKLNNPVSSSKDCDHYQVEIETTSNEAIHAKEK